VCDGVNNDCDHSAWPFLWDTNEFDDDDDGMTECAGDCNDAVTTIYLGATEVCDGLDNDCDTVVDDDAVDASTWYPDTDGDAFGDPGGPSTMACTQPAGHAANNGDCDDGDATVFPDAPEIHDGLDNQCPGDTGHGVVDEISGQTSFNSSEPPEFCWDAQAGASTYDVARSLDPMFSFWCRVFTTTDTCWSDSMSPLPGETAYYLACSTAPMTGSWGQDSNGAERTGICPPNLVANGDLENWNSPTNPASWWKTTSGGTVNEEADPAHVFAGQRAARLTRTGSGALNIVNAGIPLTPGQSYSLTLVAKASLALASGAQVRIRNATRGEDLQDNGTWSTSTNFFRFDLNTAYARQSLQFAVDAGQAAGDDFRLVIGYSSNAPIGSELWIDDAAIQSQ
jgi:hypothetical protein